MDIEKRIEAIEKKLGITPPKVTNILFVLDSSGSMATVAEQTQKNFIEQVGTLKNKADLLGETTFTLIKFGAKPDSAKIQFRDNPEVVLDVRGLPIEKMEPLKDYAPSGMTPMYDAIGWGFEILEEIEKSQTGKDVANLVVIFTDGQENASRHYTGAQIAEKVKWAKGSGRFTLQLMGADINLEDAKAILLGDCYFGYANTIHGNQIMNAAFTGALEKYSTLRSSGTVTTSLNVGQ